MALAEIDVVVQRVAYTGQVYVVDGASVYVERADGTAIQVWTTSAGTIAATLPLTSQNGRVYGWVEGGLLLRYRAVHPSLDPAAPWEFFVSGGGPVGPAGEGARATSRSVVTRNTNGTVATETDSLNWVTDQIVRNAAGAITGFRENAITRSVLRDVNGRIVEVT